MVTIDGVPSLATEALVNVPSVADVLARKREEFRRSHWPKREAGSRLMGACDPYFEPKFALSRDLSFFAVGSCFARNIEEYLLRDGLRVLSRGIRFPSEEMAANARANDLLVKYTPGSIHAEVMSALGLLKVNPEDAILETESGGYQDLFLPATYPDVTRERAIERRKQVATLFGQLRHADVLLLTLGLIEHWFDQETGLYINEPRPSMKALYPGRFVSRQLSFNENLGLVRSMVRALKIFNSNLRIVMTVSPVPLLKTFTSRDIIIANTYSKSVLRTIAEQLYLEFDYVDYFPSYEMVILSTPEEAFERDLRHVRDAAVGRIMQKFFNSYFSEEAEIGISNTKMFADARALLDSGRAREAMEVYAGLEAGHGGDVSLILNFCQAALLAKDGDTAVRLANRLMEMEPGDRSTILAARAQLVLGQHETAIRMLRRARQHENSRLHAGGWEMEAGRLAGDREAELSGALTAAEAIVNQWASPSKKPWITKRVLRVLQREGRTEVLESVKMVIAAQ